MIVFPAKAIVCASVLSKYGDKSIVVAPVLFVIVKSFPVSNKSCISFVISKSASLIFIVNQSVPLYTLVKLSVVSNQTSPSLEFVGVVGEVVTTLLITLIFVPF